MLKFLLGDLEYWYFLFFIVSIGIYQKIGKLVFFFWATSFLLSQEAQIIIFYINTSLLKIN